MRRSSPFPAALLALIALAAGSCGEQHPEGWVASSDGYGLVVPTGWSVDEDPDGASMVLWKGARDSTSPTVSIVSVDLPGEATNRNFFELNIREVVGQEGFVPIRNDTVVLDGDSVVALNYAYRIDGRFRQGILAGIVADGPDREKRGYILQCSTPNGQLEGYRQDFLALFETFRRLD